MLARSSFPTLDEKFFFPEPKRSLDGDALRTYFVDTGFKTVLVRCPRPAGIDDNVYPQARKTMEGLKSRPRASRIPYFGQSIVDRV